MSNPETTLSHDCDAAEGCGAIELILKPRDKELGGFKVRRLLPTIKRHMVGPWIFFDHMGPAVFPAGEGINVRPHPHVNLATVTYLFEGEILHRDSLGSEQVIRPGDINLMVAGRGIVHSERERPEVKAQAHRQHGLQLWLALPERDEETDPAFYNYPSEDIPTLEIGGVTVRVMMGSAYGATSPVRIFADTLYIEAHLQAGQTLALPAAEERALYVVSGSIHAQDTTIDQHEMAVLSNQPGVMVSAAEEAHIALVGGEKLGRRHIDWNFISSRKERVEQAREDWKAGRFAKVPGDDEEFIPLPT
jgi:redox-sensitive bicupin YhaK (pirin superfamily)